MSNRDQSNLFLTLDALILANQPCRKLERPSSEVARELGIRRNQLYKWRDQLAQKDDHVFTEQGRPTNAVAESFFGTFKTELVDDEDYRTR